MKHLLRVADLVSLLARRLERPWPDLAKTMTIWLKHFQLVAIDPSPARLLMTE
jgi:hypothetical protein